MSQTIQQSAPAVRLRHLVAHPGKCASGLASRALLAQIQSRIDRRLAEIVRMSLVLSRLPTELHGLTIAQISDIHAGIGTTAARIRQLVGMTNALAADIIVVTGDMVQVDGASAQTCARDLSALHAPLGVYAILGNHERRLPPSIGETPFQRAGLTVLCNAARQIGGDKGSLWIVGLDDILMRRGDLNRALDGVPEDGCKILLVHEPDFADRASQLPIDLQLSGHTHGGQIRLPGIGPLLLPVLGRKYPMGIYRVREMWLYTNRGLGVNHPTIRINCRPEITLFTLHSPAVNNDRAPRQGWSEARDPG